MKKIKENLKNYKNKVGDKAKSTQKFISDSTPELFGFLSLNELLKWSEKLTQSTATIYDKAMDAKYLATHIGGGNHRMFDGGHDLIGAWDAVKNASDDDTFKQEVIGYATGIWKDVTTTKGLPFVTWSKENYDACSTWVSENIPYASKSWFYDLMSFDVFEVFSSSLGVVSAIYLLKKDDQEKLSEILGSMGIISIISANPLMGIGVVFCTAYAYVVKKKALDKNALTLGVGLAGTSMLMFSTLGFPLLMNLVIVIVVNKLIRKTYLQKNEIYEYLKAKIKIQKPVKFQNFQKLVEG